MHTVRSSPSLCKKSSVSSNTTINSSDKKMKRSVSADALADMASDYFQTFAVSRASLEAVPCIIASIDISKTLDNEEEMKHIGVCLATPPDISCEKDTDEGETSERVVVCNRTRSRSGSRTRKHNGCSA